MLRVHCTAVARPLSRTLAGGTVVLPARTLSRTLLFQTYPRALSTSIARRNAATSAELPKAATAKEPIQSSASARAAATSPQTVPYVGPLAPTFRRLKLFSLSSLSLSFMLTPFLFIIESTLPTSARIALAGTALATSGVSTYLVAWCGRPYVSTLKTIPADDGADAPYTLEMTTKTLALRPRVTRVFDPTFLADSKRPFAKWELAQRVVLPEDTPASERPAPGSEETVAETADENGDIIGRWIVRWGEGGSGECREVGKVVRHFNIHEELLSRS